MAALTDLRGLFPSVPAKSAQWAPIYLEPMAGSGERLTAAIVCVGSHGEHHVQVTLRPKALKCMYGDRGDLVMGIAELIQESLQEHLAIGGALGDWIPPTSSCYLGPVRVALGMSLEAIARKAASLTASLSGADLTEMETDLGESSTAPDVDRWLQQIKASVRARASQFEPRFNGEVTIRVGASPTKIGYLGDRIAANFDALVPGSNLSTKRVRSKARMVDLQILRDQVDILKRTSYELLLWLPPKNSPAYSQKNLDAAHSAFLELEEFGDKHELIVRGLSDAEQAADRIIAAEGGR